MKRIPFLRLIACLLGSIGWAATSSVSAATARPRPNMVLFLVDDMG